MSNVHQFEIQTAKGKVLVQYTVESNGHETVIDNISISSNNGIELPYEKFTGLELVDRTYRLYRLSQGKIHKGTTEIHTAYDDNLSMEIADKLGQVREEETVRFGG